MIFTSHSDAHCSKIEYFYLLSMVKVHVILYSVRSVGIAAKSEDLMPIFQSWVGAVGWCDGAE